MLDAIEKLLILQDRDRRILRTRAELAHIGPERESLQRKLTDAQSRLDGVKLLLKQVESERKKLELDVDARKQQIEKYSLQQFQTRKNEEYKALAHEIETCKAAIVVLDDQQIECMERAEVAQRELSNVSREVDETRARTQGQISDLSAREGNLTRELESLTQGRDALASAVEDAARSRYERLLRTKGDTAIVGINHGVCGGCHMKLTTQAIVSCQADQELVTCPNCGRILYYTRDMALTGAD